MDLNLCVKAHGIVAVRPFEKREPETEGPEEAFRLLTTKLQELGDSGILKDASIVIFNDDRFPLETLTYSFPPR